MGEQKDKQIAVQLDHISIREQVKPKPLGQPGVLLLPHTHGTQMRGLWRLWLCPCWVPSLYDNLVKELMCLMSSQTWLSWYYFKILMCPYCLNISGYISNTTPFLYSGVCQLSICAMWVVPDIHCHPGVHPGAVIPHPQNRVKTSCT